MADKTTEAEAQEAETGGAGEEESDETAVIEKKRFSFRLTRKHMLFIGLPLLLAVGGAGYYGNATLGLLSGGGGKAQAALHAKVYYDLPEMVVNLSSGDKRVQYLKLKVSLEAENQATLNALTPVLPRVLDTFQLYLRELRSTDLEGSAGIFRLKEELLRRINVEIQPYEVSRVLFKEIIVQ